MSKVFFVVVLWWQQISHLPDGRAAPRQMYTRGLILGWNCRNGEINSDISPTPEFYGGWKVQNLAPIFDSILLWDDALVFKCNNAFEI